jgi:F-type H+-transporting ATPase subunit epsilon
MFSLTLVTPAKKILEKAPLKEVKVPAHRGELEILQGHAPLITTLEAGVLSYTLADNTEQRVAISWGYCEVTSSGEINVLAETAETKEEISVERAEAARAKALEALGKTNYENFYKNKRKFERAEARLKTVKGH